MLWNSICIPSICKAFSVVNNQGQYSNKLNILWLLFGLICVAFGWVSVEENV